MVNARFMKPLDESMLHDIMKENIPVLTIEEAVLQGGFGSSVLEFKEEFNYNSWIKRLGVPDRFIEHGSVGKLWEEIGLTEENIISQIKGITFTKQQRA